ncbi:MAG: hypothetical protein HY775_07545 [Acidobacteria bacterium]|nr:hypothetical protein [Acidobacteriota bacterium]
MRRRVFGLAPMLLAIAISTSAGASLRPAQAQQASGSGQGIDLHWADGPREVWLYAATGTSSFATGPNPAVVGTVASFGCVLVQTDDIVETGCGILDVTVDPALGAASVSGWIPSDLYRRWPGGPEWIGESGLTVDLRATAVARGTLSSAETAWPGFHSYARAGTAAERAVADGAIESHATGRMTGAIPAAIFDGLYSWTGLGA